MVSLVQFLHNFHFYLCPASFLRWRHCGGAKPTGLRSRGPTQPAASNGWTVLAPRGTLRSRFRLARSYNASISAPEPRQPAQRREPTQLSPRSRPLLCRHRLPEPFPSGPPRCVEMIRQRFPRLAFSDKFSFEMFLSNKFPHCSIANYGLAFVF